MRKFSVLFFFLIISFMSFSQPAAIKVIKEGNGNPVLYLPGFTTPGSVWKETIAHISSQREHHIVSYAGFDGVASIDTPWYPKIKEALINYIKTQKLSNITIIGHSMGGNLAVDIASALPQTVEKLILVDAIPCMQELMMPGVKRDQIQYNSPYNQQMLQMAPGAFNQVAAMMATNMTGNKAKIDTLVSWILKADRNTYVYGYTDLLKLDLRDTLKSVKAETLILGASFPNADVTKATFEKQYANLAQKTILIADNSKHFIMFDQPEWLYEKVNAFLLK